MAWHDFFRDRDGHLTVAQWPNPTIVATVALWLASTITSSRAAALRDASIGALAAWALDEVARGASPFRRVLGVVALSWAVYSLKAR